MKKYAIYITAGLTCLVLVLSLILCVMFGIRYFNSVTAVERTVQVEENVKCFVVTTSDGVATDCWKEE